MKDAQNLEKAQQYIDFVKSNLEPLAQQLKVSVEWLWQILVQQARVEGIVYLVAGISLFITSLLLSRVFFSQIKKATFGSGYGRDKYVNNKTGNEVDWDTWYDDKKGHSKIHEDNKTNVSGYISIVSGVGTILFLSVSLISTASNLNTIVTGLVNPEFRAIEKIVEFAKPAADQATTVVEKESK